MNNFLEIIEEEIRERVKQSLRSQGLSEEIHFVEDIIQDNIRGLAIKIVEDYFAQREKVKEKNK